MPAERFASHDPATGAVVWEGAAADPAAIAAALAAARGALPGWVLAPLEARIGAVRAFAGILEAQANPLAAIIARETGKMAWEARAEVAGMVAKVGVSIDAYEARTGETRNPTPFGEAVLRHRPHGVMAVLGPYNFPGHLPNGHIVPALLAGNTVIFKPSELTPGVGEAMIAAWDSAGLPPGVITLVQGGRETGAALVAADIDGLLFTGSAAAGAHFRRIFAERPKVMLALELGGNNPLIAWDGEVEEAASLVVQSAFITTGQRCSCARRLILPKGGFGEALVEAVVALADRLRIAAWNETPEGFMGPLITDATATRARAEVNALPAMGARVIRPLGTIAERRAAFVTPAILDVTEIEAPDEEIFAPVLQIHRVDDFDAALARANATRFGLSAGLVSTDDALWARFLATIRAGVVNRNRPTTGAAATMPFGGLGDSGNHRPGAFYAADYCAYPVASAEAPTPQGNAATIAKLLTP